MMSEAMSKDYLKVADFLFESIRSNDYRPGDKIPSEYELCSKFRVNRYVVRQAIGKLVNMGWLTPLQGKGCFVNDRPKRFPYVISSQTRFSDNMNKMGISHCSALVDWSLDSCNEQERRVLQLSEDERVYRLEIVRYAEQLPISVTTSVIPRKFVPDLEKHLPDFCSLYQILQTNYGLHPIRIRSEIEAALPTNREAELLEMPMQVPILRLENLMVNARRVPVEFGIARVRGDRNHCVVEFDTELPHANTVKES